MGTGRLEGKVAVVTGGASGIGKAAAFRLCRAGASVMVADRDAAAAKVMLDEAAAAGHGNSIRYRPTDVSVEEDVADLMAATIETFGDLDVVFNNAAVRDTIVPLVDVSVEHWDNVMAVNARGVFLGIKHGARAMLAAGHGGAIVNTASIDGLSASSGFPSYSSAKAAIINLTRVAAVELAPALIRVNVICPGGVLTPMLAQGDEEGTRQWLASLQPWPEPAVPEDIASLVEFLASDDSRIITGETVVIDGGLMAGGARLSEKIRARIHAKLAADASASTSQGEPA